MKYRMIGVLFFASLSQLALAADINCRGAVSWLVADLPQCGGHMAFKTEATGGKNGKWMCTKSKEAGSVVLTALVAGKVVEAYIEGSDVSSCLDLPQYRKISYIILNP